jgi:hypothetical protein
MSSLGDAKSSLGDVQVPGKLAEQHRRYLRTKADGDFVAEEALKKAEKVCTVTAGLRFWVGKKRRAASRPYGVWGC